MEIVLKTLTPIWTGNVDRNSELVKETGLVGSLRWWYGGIVRAMCKDPSAGTSAIDKLFGNGGDASRARQFILRATAASSVPLLFMCPDSMYLATGNWLSRIYPDGTR